MSSSILNLVDVTRSLIQKNVFFLSLIRNWILVNTSSFVFFMGQVSSFLLCSRWTVNGFVKVRKRLKDKRYEWCQKYFPPYILRKFIFIEIEMLFLNKTGEKMYWNKLNKFFFIFIRVESKCKRSSYTFYECVHVTRLCVLVYV